MFLNTGGNCVEDGSCVSSSSFAVCISFLLSSVSKLELKLNFGADLLLLNSNGYLGYVLGVLCYVPNWLLDVTDDALIYAFFALNYSNNASIISSIVVMNLNFPIEFTPAINL
jgi:hypothetical protein